MTVPLIMYSNGALETMIL